MELFKCNDPPVIILDGWTANFQFIDSISVHVVLKMILPQFKIENLPSGSEFKVNVFARNEKGISDKTEVLPPDDFSL